MGLNLYPWFCLYFTKVSFWPQPFFPKNEEISTPPPCHCWLEYTYFMRVGQPKPSESKRLKEVGCLFHLQVITGNQIQESKITSWKRGWRACRKILLTSKNEVFGFTWPFPSMRSLIVPHSMASLFSQSRPGICLGTFSTASTVEISGAVVQRVVVWAIMVNIKSIYVTCRFCIRHLQALGGFGRLDPKWLDVSERTLK